MKACIRCGNLLNDDAVFCQFCGTSNVVASNVPQQPVNNTAAANSLNSVNYPVGGPTVYSNANMVLPLNGADAGYGSWNGIQAPKKSRNKKKLLTFICVLLGLAIVGTVLFFVLRKSEAEKIISAFQKTLMAESFTCDGSASYYREHVEFSGEILGDKNNNQFFLSYTEYYRRREEDDRPESYAYVDGKMYSKSYGYYDDDYWEWIDDWEYREEKNEEASKVLDKLCQRDFIGAIKASKSIENDVKEYCKNYEEIPDILLKLVKDCVKADSDTDFIKSMKKRDNGSYTFVIDPEKLLKALKKEYGVKIDEDLYDDALREIERYELGDAELTFKIEKGYVTSITGEIEVDGRTAEAEITFSNFNKVDAKKSNAAELAAEAQEQLNKRSEEKKNTVTLTMWCHETKSESTRGAFEMAISEMSTRHPEIKINWEATEYEVYKQKLKSASYSGGLPDIFEAWSCSYLEEYVQNGNVYCLNDAYREFSSSLPEKMCENSTYDGRKYGVPLSMNCVFLFANMDILARVGYVSVPQTYEELMKCCDDLIAAGYTPFGLGGYEAWCVTEYLESIIEKTCGAETLNDIFRMKADWYNGDVAESVDMFRDMVKKGYFGEYPQYNSNNDVKNEFIAGKYAFYINGTWNCSEFAYSGLNVQISEFPVINEEKAKNGQLIGGSSDILAVSSTSRHADVAAQYAFELGQLISKYEYLTNCGITPWVIDYDDSGVNELSRVAAEYVRNADSLVLYGDTAMNADEASRYLAECSMLINDIEYYDGKRFIEKLNRSEFRDETLEMYDPDAIYLKSRIAGYDPNRDLHNAVIVIGDWWTEDYWNADSYWNSYATWKPSVAAYVDFQKKMMSKHNYSIMKKSVITWGEVELYYLSIVTNEPLSDVMTFDYRFFGMMMNMTGYSEEPLLIDVSKVPEFDFTDEKWNKQVLQCASVGSAIYGFSDYYSTTTGVFWNKDLVMKYLGAGEIDKLYDWQASGEWTWEKFKEFAKKCTIDTDYDSVTDIYGLTAQQSILFEAAMVSNGHLIVSRDDAGKYVNNAESREITSDCEWAYALYSEGLIRRKSNGDNWDYFQTNFREQKSVMLVAEEWYSSTVASYDFDYGFVCFPKGPNVSYYVTDAHENIMAIPNCDRTLGKLSDIAFAYNIFTTQPPDYQEDPQAWKTSYETYYRDSRAVDETIYMMLYKNTRIMQPSYVIPSLWDNNQGIIQAQLLYYIDEADMTPARRLTEISPKIQECVDKFNSSYVK